MRKGLVLVVTVYSRLGPALMGTTLIETLVLFTVVLIPLAKGFITHTLWRKKMKFDPGFLKLTRPLGPAL
jgi:hypothetical protein